LAAPRTARCGPVLKYLPQGVFSGKTEFYVSKASEGTCEATKRSRKKGSGNLIKMQQSLIRIRAVRLKAARTVQIVIDAGIRSGSYKRW